MSTLDICTLLAALTSLLSLLARDSKRREFSSLMAIFLSLSPVLIKANAIVAVVLLVLLLILVILGLEIEQERLRSFKFPLNSRLPIILMGMVLTVGVTIAVYWAEKASFMSLSFGGEANHWWRFLFALTLILHVILLVSKKGCSKERLK